jgi:outer membrane protein TolC
MRLFRWCWLVVCLLGVPARLTAQADAAGGGIPLSLADARREALARDPALAELNAEKEAASQRARQTAFLDAPMLEGQVWQWPVNTLNPSKADMYMLSVSQEFPGRGKRALRAAVVQTDVVAVQARIESRTRELDSDVRIAYVELVTVRHALDTQSLALPLLRQAVAASEARYEAKELTYWAIRRRATYRWQSTQLIVSDTSALAARSRSLRPDAWISCCSAF